MFCPSCNARMHSKGIYKRTVKHPIFQDSTLLNLIIRQRRWRCPDCGLVYKSHLIDMSGESYRILATKKWNERNGIND